MDDEIGKVNPISTGRDTMSIRGEHTTNSRPKIQKKTKQVFVDVLQQKEVKITDEEKKKKQQTHAKYKDGKRVT